MNGTGKTFWAFTRYNSYELSKGKFVSSEKVFLNYMRELNYRLESKNLPTSDLQLTNKLTFVFKRGFFLTFPYKILLQVFI